MKTFKFLALIAAVLIISCVKEGPIGPTGAEGPTGPSGPAATTQSYILNFDGTTSWVSYSGFEGLYEANDVIISYIAWDNYGGDDYYVQLPYTDAGTSSSSYAEVNNVDGHIYQNIEDDLGLVYFTSSTNIGYKSVLIKGRSLQGMPDDFDFSDYNKVKEYFVLED